MLVPSLSGSLVKVSCFGSCDGARQPTLDDVAVVGQRHCIFLEYGSKLDTTPVEHKGVLEGHPGLACDADQDQQ